MGASAAPNMTLSLPCADALRLMLRIQPRSFQAAARRPSPGLATGALARPRRQQPRTGKYSARVDRVYSFDDWRDQNLLGHGRHECLADRGWIPPHNAWRS